MLKSGRQPPNAWPAPIAEDIRYMPVPDRTTRGVIWGIAWGSDLGVSMGFDHPICDNLLDKMFGIAEETRHWEVMNELASSTYENVLDSGFYSVNILWPIGPKLEVWPDHLDYGDTRAFGSYEYAQPRNR